MDGLDVPMDTTVYPEAVAARLSTDTIAVEDSRLNAALHFIHNNIDTPFGVDRVVQATLISRRQLEIRFRRMLNCTPHDYICQKRVERAKQFLAAPEKIKFHKLAMLCGFPNVERMRLIFKRVTGMTPREYSQAEARLRCNDKQDTL